MTTISVDGNKISTTLVAIDHGISLITIPPPISDDLTDISYWSLTSKIWTGKLKVIENEQIQVDEQPINSHDLIKGEILFLNSNNSVFGAVNYDVTGENVLITTSKRAYRILIDYSGKKVALGLIFEDSEVAQQFSIGLQNVKKHAEEAIEAQSDFVNELSTDLKHLNIKQESDSSEDTGVFDQNINVDNHNAGNEDDDDDDFGDFVEG